MGPSELTVLLVILAVWLVPVVAAVDAAQQPTWAFEEAGTSKTLWIVLPLVGSAACLVGLGAAVMWYTSTKPKVVAASARRPPAPGEPPA